MFGVCEKLTYFLKYAVNAIARKYPRIKFTFLHLEMFRVIPFARGFRPRPLVRSMQSSTDAEILAIQLKHKKEVVDSIGSTVVWVSFFAFCFGMNAYSQGKTYRAMLETPAVMQKLTETKTQGTTDE